MIETRAFNASAVAAGVIMVIGIIAVYDVAVGSVDVRIVVTFFAAVYWAVLAVCYKCYFHDCSCFGAVCVSAVVVG